LLGSWTLTNEILHKMVSIFPKPIESAIEIGITVEIGFRLEITISIPISISILIHQTHFGSGPYGLGVTARRAPLLRGGLGNRFGNPHHIA